MATVTTDTGRTTHLTEPRRQDGGGPPGRAPAGGGEELSQGSEGVLFEGGGVCRRDFIGSVYNGSHCGFGPGQADSSSAQVRGVWLADQGAPNSRRAYLVLLLRLLVLAAKTTFWQAGFSLLCLSVGGCSDVRGFRGEVCFARWLDGEGNLFRVGDMGFDRRLEELSESLGMGEGGRTHSIALDSFNRQCVKYSTTTSDSDTHEDFQPTRKLEGDNLKDIVEQDIKYNPIMIYMKGMPDAPRCGFSALAVRVLKEYGIPFSARNILEDHELKDSIKAISNWPTFPQIFIKGEFIGGSDIVLSMHQSGELGEKLKDITPTPTPKET
ncbi:hypothetical protein Taro_054468 [Colocasia esculenta]|uniref:Glutaredoxin domain-containing protein n=1 Tax=Colocasia esculenta TaxID=4460 RepID=A0A843XNK9_COLES|nr:hypothetical protein [Colocasia esculenta]